MNSNSITILLLLTAFTGKLYTPTVRCRTQDHLVSETRYTVVDHHRLAVDLHGPVHGLQDRSQRHLFIDTGVHHFPAAGQTTRFLFYKKPSYKGSHHKRKTEKFGKNSLMGGRGKFFSKKSQFQFGNIENPRGGLNFSKMSEFQLFDSVVCNITFTRNV